MSMLEVLQEAVWLKKLNKRDEVAFGRYYEMYAPKLYRHAFYRLSSKELAEDVVSEVFIKTWQFLAEPGKEITNIKAFLYRLANNLIIDNYRSRGRQPFLIDDVLEARLSDSGVAAGTTIDRLDLQIVLKNLEKISSEVRELLFWRYVDELSIEEISKVTGKTRNAIYVAIHRGLKELKRLTEYENKNN